MRRLLLKLVRRHRLERDIAAELAHHRSQGGPLGNATLLAEQARDLWRFTFLENLWRDVVYGARGLARSPAVVFGAVLSLALGIGANATVVSVVKELLFSKPSVRDEASLARVDLNGGFANRRLFEFARESGVFADVVGESEESNARGRINWSAGGQTVSVYRSQVTKNYFAMLGVPMALGRGILASDPDQVAVLHDRFWRRYLNSDPDIIGQSITLDGAPYRVVGVLPPDYHALMGFGYSPDLFLPVTAADTSLLLYARLKPGMPRSQIEAGLRVAAAQWNAANPGLYTISGRSNFHPLGLVDWHTLFQRGLTGGATLVLFFGTLLLLSALVVLIACVNVAGLLLARGAARREEIAVRLALGAGRRRLIQQLLVESLLLALLGAVCGLALAWGSAKLLAGVDLHLGIPIFLRVSPDWRLALYAALLTAAVTLASGLLPAFQGVRGAVAADLKRDSRLRLRRALLAAQIAVSTLVLAAGFVFLRNLARASSLDPGFDVEHTLVADVFLPAGYPEERAPGFVDDALRELRATPGVEAAAAAQGIPLVEPVGSYESLAAPGKLDLFDVHYGHSTVTPGFFEAMGIPLIEGRDLRESDRGADPTTAVVVNWEFAHRYFGASNPVGITLWSSLRGRPMWRIVGVVGNTKQASLGEEPQPQVYELLSFTAPWAFFGKRVTFVVRAPASTVGLRRPVEQVLRRTEPAAGVQVQTMSASLSRVFLPSRAGAIGMGSVGMLGLLLAAVGLYGMVTYAVVQRTREIGIRMAIGATRGDVSRMVLRDAMWPVAVGSGIGLGIAFFAVRPLAIFLVTGLEPVDPLSFLGVVGVMAAAIAAACWGPIVRAIRVNPASLLR